MHSKAIHKHEHRLLILSSILVALIYTLPFLSGIFRSSSESTNPFFNTQMIINRSLYGFCNSLISMLIFTYFNYFWRRKILPVRIKKVYRILIIFLYNVVLVFILILIAVYANEFTFGNKGGFQWTFFFYLWKYLFLNPVGILIANILNLIVKTRNYEIENIKLKEENLAVQLQTLRNQVNPHFLFNTLNTLSSVIRVGKKQDGLKFVDDLSSVYRYILESDKNNLVGLKNELDFLNSYIFMLNKRFSDNFVINIDIPDGIMDSKIPPMVLQALVENAVKHNEISHVSPLQVEIYVEKDFIIVKNNLKEKISEEEKLGLGLPNLIKRYKLLSNKDVIINQRENSFFVMLPVIRS